VKEASKELLKNIQRQAKQGRDVASSPPRESGYTDKFQRILDLVQEIEAQEK